MTNETFRFLFIRYFQSGELNFFDKLLARISTPFLFRKNAKIISDAFKQIEPLDEHKNSKEIQIEKYSGSNVVAKKVSDCLKKKAGDLLIGAYVHGSIGTYEEVSYSDFDGLVIIKNKTFKNPQELFLVSQVLKETEIMMREMDPLQHHGWFVMSELDMMDFPETYFPHELLFHAKCLLGENKLRIQLRETGLQNEFKKSFLRLSKSISAKLESGSFLENQYAFKNLLSEFMLLPCIYIQAKTGEGVYKKFSFEKVQSELKEKYNVMNEISAIRSQWNYIPPPLFQEKLRAANRKNINRDAKKYSGKISEEQVNKFDQSLIHQMKDFVNELKLHLLK